MIKEKIINLLGRAMKGIAVCMTPFVSNGCRAWWYQPEEPNGFENFIKDFKKNDMNKI